jgi:hypothetical protein
MSGPRAESPTLCVQYLRFHRKGHAFCRVQGPKEENHNVLRDQERSEVAEAEGVSGGAICLGNELTSPPLP